MSKRYVSGDFVKRAVVLPLAAAIALSVLSICGCGPYHHYDHTGELDNIASVEIFDITYVSGCEEELEYEVKRVFDKDEWAQVIGDAALLDYSSPFPNPVFWQEGLALKIAFIEPVAGNAYVFLTRWAPVLAETKDGKIKLESYSPACDSEQWEEFMAKYLGE